MMSMACCLNFVINQPLKINGCNMVKKFEELWADEDALLDDKSDSPSMTTRADAPTPTRRINKEEWNQHRIGGFGYGCLTILLVWWFLGSGFRSFQESFMDFGVNGGVAEIYTVLVQFCIIAFVVAKGIGGTTPFDEFTSLSARVYMVVGAVLFLGSSWVISYFI